MDRAGRVAGSGGARLGAAVRADGQHAAGVEREEQAVGQRVGAEEEVPHALVDGARGLLERHLRDLEDAADLVDEQADGLVVDRILDIATERIGTRSDIDDQALVGSVVVGDKVVELLDMQSAVLAADPHFYSGASVSSGQEALA